MSDDFICKTKSIFDIYLKEMNIRFSKLERDDDLDWTDNHMLDVMEKNGDIPLKLVWFRDYSDLIDLLKKTDYGSELLIIVADARDTFPITDDGYVVYGFDLSKWHE